eukprot:6702264-Pyramimonas_sp.AAC.1
MPAALVILALALVPTTLSLALAIPALGDLLGRVVLPPASMFPVRGFQAPAALVHLRAVLGAHRARRGVRARTL